MKNAQMNQVASVSKSYNNGGYRGPKGSQWISQVGIEIEAIIKGDLVNSEIIDRFLERGVGILDTAKFREIVKAHGITGGWNLFKALNKVATVNGEAPLYRELKSPGVFSNALITEFAPITRAIVVEGLKNLDRVPNLIKWAWGALRLEAQDKDQILESLKKISSTEGNLEAIFLAEKAVAKANRALERAQALIAEMTTATEALEAPESPVS